jgi:hypothetical protein
MELKEGGPCQVYKNGWRPAVLVKMGRKHAVVKFADKEHNSHVPATSVKELNHNPKDPAPPPEEKEEDGYFIDEKDESYLKIKHRTRIVAVVPRAYRSEADVMLNALRDTEPSREQIIAKALEGVEPIPGMAEALAAPIREIMDKPGLARPKTEEKPDAKKSALDRL